MEKYTQNIFIAVGMLVIFSVGLSWLYLVEEPVTGQSFLLDESFAEAATTTCSRAAPIIDGAWRPTETHLENLERDLQKLSLLRSKLCCISDESIQNPADSYRQYVGVVIAGEEFIYINAVKKSVYTEDLEIGFSNLDYFSKKPFMVCDGGSSYWGALYNPKTRSFQDLAFNGRG